MRKELSVHQVIGFWYDTIAGVVRSPQRSLPDRLSDWVFDAKATRTICKMIVEEFPSYNQPVARALRAHHEGTDNFDHVELCADFVGELGVWLQSNPAYPCYKEEGTYREPDEYTATELQKILGFKHFEQCRRFLTDEHHLCPGLSKCGTRWYLQSGTLKILQEKCKLANKAA
jgi:hypothetical protein